MCCPLQNASGNPWIFQLGRALGYLSMWLLLRMISWSLVSRFGTPIFQLVSLMLISWILLEACHLIWGWRLPKIPLLSQLGLKSRGNFSFPLTSGMSLSVRGCGWMWSFVALAASDDNWGMSLLKLFTFYLGTQLPFLAAPWLSKTWALSNPAKGRWLLAIAFSQMYMSFGGGLSTIHELQEKMLGTEQASVHAPIGFCGVFKSKAEEK
jgi:sulfite exporter TauE/SafE